MNAQPDAAVLPFLDRQATRIAVMIALFAAALAVRLPSLMQVPRFEDEGLDLLLGLDIARGHALPLTGVDLYTGPLYVYLVAGMIRLFGENILWPRLLAAVFGGLTVAATFQLGRTVANNFVGLLAALLALTSPMLVLVSSHFGWPNSLTPFFATVTLTAVYVGVVRRRPAALASGGFLAAMTVQTHPLSVVLLVGIATWYLVVCPRREWLRRREVVLGVITFAAGCAPMLWTLDSRWAEFARGVGQQTYAFAPVQSAGQYLGRLRELFDLLLFTVTGTGERMWDGFAGMHWVGTMIQIATLIAIVRGLSVAPARAFLIAAFLIPGLLFPLVTQSFQSRYLLLLVPVGLVIAATAVERLRSRSARRSLAAACAVLLGINLIAIARVHQAAAQTGTTNAAFFKLQQTLAINRACQDGVFLEDPGKVALAGEDRVWTYFNFQAIRTLLTVDGCTLTVAPAERLLELARERPVPTWMIILEQRVASQSGDVELRRVQAISPGPAVSDSAQFTLVRTGPPK